MEKQFLGYFSPRRPASYIEKHWIEIGNQLKLLTYSNYETSYWYNISLSAQIQGMSSTLNAKKCVIEYEYKTIQCRFFKRRQIL